LVVESEIDIDGVALRNLVEDFSETVDEMCLFVISFVEVDDLVIV
jgi:hypothetical protein